MDSASGGEPTKIFRVIHVQPAKQIYSDKNNPMSLKSVTINLQFQFNESLFPCWRQNHSWFLPWAPYVGEKKRESWQLSRGDDCGWASPDPSLNGPLVTCNSGWCVSLFDAWKINQNIKFDPSLDSSIGSTTAWYHGACGFKSQQGRGFFFKYMNLSALFEMPASLEFIITLH